MHRVHSATGRQAVRQSSGFLSSGQFESKRTSIPRQGSECLRETSWPTASFTMACQDFGYKKCISASASSIVSFFHTFFVCVCFPPPFNLARFTGCRLQFCLCRPGTFHRDHNYKMGVVDRIQSWKKKHVTRQTAHAVTPKTPGSQYLFRVTQPMACLLRSPHELEPLKLWLTYTLTPGIHFALNSVDSTDLY